MHLTLDLSYVDKTLPTYAAFIAWVDQAAAGSPGYGFSAMDAAYAWRLTGSAEYAALAIKTAEDQVALAEKAIAAGGKPQAAMDSYYFAGGEVSNIALVYDWLGDQLTVAQKTRWGAYCEQVIANIWNAAPATSTWGGWSGWATDNPASNYFYNFLEATMYWAIASGSVKWLDLLRTSKLPRLTAYFATMPGGGSEEGTGYGISHARAFALYSVWRDCTGEDLTDAHLTNSIAWWVHATTPTLDRFAPLGDQARVSEPALYDYHRALMLKALRMTKDTAAQDLAAWWLHHISIPVMTSGFNRRDDLLPAGRADAPEPVALDFVAPETGQWFARTSWDTDAAWLVLNAGAYTEDHAAQDQGGFTLFHGDWLAVTENNWTHSGIDQSTPAHNVLRFEDAAGRPVAQKYPTHSTLVVDGSQAHADLSPAYRGAIGSWKRQVDFVGAVLTVTDRFALGAAKRAVFQVNTPTKPVINGNTIRAGALQVRVLEPAQPVISVIDWTTQTSASNGKDYLSGWRIDIAGSDSQYVVELCAVGVANGPAPTPAPAPSPAPAPPPAPGAITVTRKGRWQVVGGTAHNTSDEAIEYAANMALTSPGTVVVINPPAMEVVAK